LPVLPGWRRHRSPYRAGIAALIGKQRFDFIGDLLEQRYEAVNVVGFSAN
jgi:hypothetical protein